jgi:hypothetical protein
MRKRAHHDDRREGLRVGRNLAVTPGSVVFRNDLIELIQYDATTPTVHKRPLVIVPPCINKYYILDLRPENSLVRHAVAEGHTVFMVSWRNVPPELGHLTWDDYIEDGVLTALRVAREISGSKTVNALGFCVGGTLLACALAVLAARRDASVTSTTFLTAMLDFADPGDIGGIRLARILPRANRRSKPTRARERTWLVRSRQLRANDPRLELRHQQLPQGRDAAGIRPPLLERRLGQPARPDVRLLPKTCTSTTAARTRRADDGRRAIDLSRIVIPAYVTRRATITSCRGVPLPDTELWQRLRS